MTRRRPSDDSQLAVLFIGGHSRSGSTLMSRILGEDASVVSVGELLFIGDRGFRDNQLCSCGEPFRQCEFWIQVVDLVGGLSPDRWFARLVQLKQEVARIRFVPTLALARSGRGTFALSAPARAYTEMLGEILTAISAAAGVDTVIDSSKHPAYGFFLANSRRFDLYPAHLVRDCRAVAFSQQRTRVRPEIYWTTEIMPRFSPSRTAFDWVLLNALMHQLGAVSGRYRRVRYEDLVADPRGVCRELLDWVGVGSSATVNGAQARHPAGHELSGNPMRLQRDFKVTPDTEWCTSMPARDRGVATTLGAPLLAKYGYPLFARSQLGTSGLTRDREGPS